MRTHAWTVTPSPFILTSPSVPVLSMITAATLIPHIVMLIVTGDLQALTNITVSILASILAEFCSENRSRSFYSSLYSSAVVTGIVTGLLLPITLNPLLSFLFSFTGILLARVLFGGTGSYWIHPVAVAVGIAYISIPSAFPQMLVSAEGISAVGDAFGAVKLDNFVLSPHDIPVTGFLNSIFSGTLGIKIPEGYVTLFWNVPCTIPAFRYNIFTLGASIILLALRLIDWIVPFCFVLVYSLLVRYFSLSLLVSGETHGDILFALLTGGMLFQAFYVLADYSSIPRTPVGKVIIGVLSGVFAFLLCGPGGTPMGGIFSVLLANSLVPLVELAENSLIARRGRRYT